MSHIAGLLESTAPGIVMADAGVSVVRGIGGAVANAAMVAAIRLEPGMTLGSTSSTTARTTDNEPLVFTDMDYGRGDAFVSPLRKSSRYPVHDVSRCHGLRRRRPRY